jgi:predicted transposase YdaD
MPGPLDDTLKHLTELAPADWVIQGGWAPGPATLVDADIATIAGASDKVIRVAGSPDWLLAVDFQAGHDVLAKLPDLLLYNSALYRRHGLPVRSLLVILHPGADSPQATGYYERGFANEPFDVALRYRALRVWQVPAWQWLTGGLGLVPLAPLGEVPPRQLPRVIAQMKRRLDREATPRLAKELWSATYILMGLRYDQALIQAVLKGVGKMKESVTYQAILEEGKTEGSVQEARKMILLQGRSRFKQPASPQVVAALEAITEASRLEELGVRLLQVSSWQELLGTNGGGRRGRRRTPSSH